MADDYSLTNRFKFPVPVLNHTNWLDLLTHWAELNDVMLTTLSNKDYVISGLEVITTTSSLNFTYTGGVVSINGSSVIVSSGGGTFIADRFNWIYVQSGVVKVSAYPPTGVSYVPIVSAQVDDTGTVGEADLRPSPPVINGSTITPVQVNPTSNINMESGMRVIHADSNVGNNTVMFSRNEVRQIVNWGNKTAAMAWVQQDLSTYVPAGTKFAILNIRMATLNVDAIGWALLDVKTLSGDIDYLNMVSDHGHGAAVTLNPHSWGTSIQIILPVDTDKKFWVRTMVSNITGLGKYYAAVHLLGYVI